MGEERFPGRYSMINCTESEEEDSAAANSSNIVNWKAAETDRAGWRKLLEETKTQPQIIVLTR